MPIQRPTTITAQVTEILGQRLRDGVYPPGSRIPSESELAADLQVSRTTVRNALAKFAADGLLIRKQGDGTYVSARALEIDQRYGGQWDFARVIEGNGFNPSIHMVDRHQRPIGEDELGSFGLAKKQIVWQVDRLFYANENPAIFVTNVVPLTYFHNKQQIPDGRLHIHDLLDSVCGQTVAYATTDIEAVTWQQIPQVFKKGRDERPMLKLTEVFYNRDNLPLALGTSFYDDSILRLRLIRS